MAQGPKPKAVAGVSEELPFFILFLFYFIFQVRSGAGAKAHGCRGITVEEFNFFFFFFLGGCNHGAGAEAHGCSGGVTVEEFSCHGEGE